MFITNNCQQIKNNLNKREKSNNFCNDYKLLIIRVKYS